MRTEFDEGRQNFVAFIEVHKLVLADDVMDSKKSAEVERDVNSISGRVEQVEQTLFILDSSISSKLFSLEVQ